MEEQEIVDSNDTSSNLEDHLNAMRKQIDEINKLKKQVENMKLVNRPDVQIIQRQLADVNLSISFAERDKEHKETAFKNATLYLDKLQSKQTQLQKYLSIITNAHNEHRKKQLKFLMEKMKCT